MQDFTAKSNSFIFVEISSDQNSNPM